MSKHMTNTHKNKYKQTNKQNKQTNKRKIKFSTKLHISTICRRPKRKNESTNETQSPMQGAHRHNTTLQQHTTYIRQL